MIKTDWRGKAQRIIGPSGYVGGRVPWIQLGSHLQTILAGVHPMTYPRDVPPAEDRIVVMVGKDANLQVELTAHHSGCPLIVMFHGFTGNANSPIMLRGLRAAHLRGYAVARINLRNAGGTHRLSKGLFHLHQWPDIGRAVEQIISHVTPSRAYAIGFSVGGNLLLNQLAREPMYKGLFRAVAAINPPIDVPLSAAAVSERRNWIYMRSFVRALSATVRRKRALGEKYADPESPRVMTVPEFDERFILSEARMPSVREYYEVASSKPHLHHMRTPTLLVVSKDDPIVPVSMFDGIERLSPNIHLAVREHGGHIGYFYPTGGPSGFWAADVSLDFFENY